MPSGEVKKHMPWQIFLSTPCGVGRCGKQTIQASGGLLRNFPIVPSTKCIFFGVGTVFLMTPVEPTMHQENAAWFVNCLF